MPDTGYRMNAVNLTVNGTTYNGALDLDLAFEALGTASPAAASGFKVAGGADLSTLFHPLSVGGTQLAQATAFAIGGGADLRTLYAAKGSVAGGGGGGCLPFETPVPLWDGGTKALGDLRPGDVIIGYYVPGMTDESRADWRDWTASIAEVDEGFPLPVTVTLAFHGAYPWHYLIDGDIRATFEHTFLVLRGEEWAWRRAEDIRVGDFMMGPWGGAREIRTIERIEELRVMANANVEDVDNFFFLDESGEWILSHNPGTKN